MPQSQQGQNTSAQPTGQNQQQGHGHGQAHLATGGQYGQLPVTQQVQGGSLATGGQYGQFPATQGGSLGGQYGRFPAAQQVQGGSLGGQYGQYSATQHTQGSSLGGNMVQMQSNSAPGQQTQYPQDIRFRNALTPGNYQGGTGQGGSSSTSAASGLGAGAGGHGATFHADPFRPHRGAGMPPNRGTHGAKPSRGQRG
ncbi:hypothetical protein BGY98DRAFT_935361 [Russula aff. rugulosa BPL654]|nr:hypothetical protein BGY98DRAFT_935361 [Russula aff. rugulosa BPL654]